MLVINCQLVLFNSYNGMHNINEKSLLIYKITSTKEIKLIENIAINLS